MKFERVNPGQIEQVFRRGWQAVTRLQPKRFCGIGTQHTFPQHRQHIALGDGQPAKIEIIQSHAHQRMVPNVEADIDRQGIGPTRLADAVRFCHGDAALIGGIKIQGIERQIQCAASGAYQQRR